MFLAPPLWVCIFRSLFVLQNYVLKLMTSTIETILTTNFKQRYRYNILCKTSCMPGHKPNIVCNLKTIF